MTAIQAAAHLSYRLPASFVATYADRPPPFGFPCGADNTLGEVTFVGKHSNLKSDGSKERWWEVCQRVVEGMYSALKDHCLRNRTPWTDEHAHEDATQAFDRMFNFKWMPAGRGVQYMGTEYVARQGSAVLQNCAFLSTKDMAADPARAFCRLMEMSMLGVGVGMDTRGAGTLRVLEKHTGEGYAKFCIADSREGWVVSLRLLLESYFVEGSDSIDFDYSAIRPAGAPLKTLGGFAGGPKVLMEMHDRLRARLDAYRGQEVDSRLITDIANLVGQCVVSGNNRRTAEIIFGQADDKDFLNLKNWTLEENAERMDPVTGWGSLSNNTVFRADNMGHLADAIVVNGEPGILDLKLAQDYGRLVDPPNGKNWRVLGANPCVEQPLEDNELCNLVETYPTHHDDIADFLRTMKYAYLYGKAVTLIPTHWPECNEVMVRNRRIGLSMTGIFEFTEMYGSQMMREWCDLGYAEVCRRDVQYSDWLGIRESIGKTSVKPSGTVSLEAGVTPGVHAPVAGGSYLRRVRYGVHNPILAVLRDAGYPCEPAVGDPERTVVVTFPVRGPEVRSEAEVSVWEKASLAALLQAHWADNMVSATFSFRADEEDQIRPLIDAFSGRLKCMSFLPKGAAGRKYDQMPYETTSKEEFEKIEEGIKPIDRDALYLVQTEASGDKFCDSDKCSI